MNVFELPILFRKDRRTLNEANKNNAFLVGYVNHEVNEELQEELNRIEAGEERREQAALEAIDAIGLLVQIISNLGYSAAEIELLMRDKWAFNALQHHPRFYNNGVGFDEGYKLAKEDSRKERLKEWYYSAPLR